MNTLMNQKAVKMIEQEEQVKDNLAIGLQSLIENATVIDEQQPLYTFTDGKFKRVSAIDKDLLMQSLVMYISARDRALHEHAYNMGKKEGKNV